MKALYIEQGGRSIDVRRVIPAPQSGECRIRVGLAGICGTDLQLLQGYAGFEGIPGHEFVGVVDEVATEADAAWIGRRVAGEINVGCGRCRWCRNGIKEHCPARTVLGIKNRAGAFAESLWLPAANLHALPASLDDTTAVFIEPTAAACQVLAQVDPRSGAEIVILGDGRMGLLVGQVLATTGAHVTVVGKHEEKLDVARGLGLDAIALDGVQAGRSAEIVVDVTGRPGGLTTALRLVRPRGTVVVKSTFHGPTTAAISSAVVNEVRVVGSRCGPFAPAIELLATERVHTAPLLAGTFGLDDHEEAFDQARTGLKILFKLPNRASRPSPATPVLSK